MQVSGPALIHTLTRRDLNAPHLCPDDVGLVVTALAGLRLGGALSVPIAMFTVILAAVVEWFLARRDT